MKCGMKKLLSNSVVSYITVILLGVNVSLVSYLIDGNPAEIAGILIVLSTSVAIAVSPERSIVSAVTCLKIYHVIISFVIALFVSEFLAEFMMVFFLFLSFYSSQVYFLNVKL